MYILNPLELDKITRMFSTFALHNNNNNDNIEVLYSARVPIIHTFRKIGY